ncbi:MAG: GNAT family N-acetyltransferase [Trueperaceae bacterium]|nr:GNAT family N-acetyltransferase [Trueperaceae bacterium]
MSLSIRPLNAEDYPATTEIFNAQNEPDHRLSNDQLRASDERLRQRGTHLLLSAVDDRDVIGRGQISEWPDDGEPGKFWTWFFVCEDRRGTGVDSAMFDAGLELLAGRDPTSLWTCVREDFLPTFGYLRERGYEEQFRSWGAHLVLNDLELRALATYRDAVAERGVTLRTYQELASDPSRDAKLSALQDELEEEAPHFEPIIPKRHPRPSDSGVLLGSYVVAVVEGEYVGIASLNGEEGSASMAGSGLVGVRREFRNRGIGTALLAHTSSWAKERGFSEVNAGGAGANAAMLNVVGRVGFDVEPAWVTLAKFL